MAIDGINQVGRVTQTTGTQSTEAPEQVERERLELYQHEAFERGVSSNFSDFREFQLALSDEQKAAVLKLFNSVSGEQRAQIEAASQQLAQALLEPGAIGPTGTMSSGLSNASTVALTTFVTTTGSDNVNDAMLGFMGMALGGLENTLLGYTNRMQTNLQLAKELRESVTELRDVLQNWPPAPGEMFSYVEVTYDKDGNPIVQEKQVDLSKMTKEAVEELMNKLESQLASVKDFGEQLKFDLQDHYQKVQQAVQMFAAIQKDFHDNAKQIINNLKA